MTDEQLQDYKQRLEDAEYKLMLMSFEAYANGDMQERWRLQGKAKGVQLALDYLQAY